MANPNKSANPSNWAKNPMERIDAKIFAQYRDYIKFVDEMKAAGYRTRTTRTRQGRRKVFVYKQERG